MVDGSLEKIEKAHDDFSLGSLNLNSVSDKPTKKLQVADDGIFNRTRGQGLPNQRGRAHPFRDTGVTYSPDGKTLVVGQDPPAISTPVTSFKDHVVEEAPEFQALGDKQQGEVAAAVSGRIQGNAIAVGFADNAKRAADLAKDWDLIGPQDISGSIARVIGVGTFGIGMGIFAHGRLQKALRDEKASTEPVFDAHRKAVEAIKDKVGKEMFKAIPDVSRADEASGLIAKYDFLGEYIKSEPQNKLDILARVNKDRPEAFTAAERDSMKAMAEAEMKLVAANKSLDVSSELKGIRAVVGHGTAVYEHGRTGLWNGMKFVAGSLGVNYVLKEVSHFLPGDDHHETDRIFTQSTQESAVQALIGA